MDELDPIRELVVEAMAELERALNDGLPAQAPRSGTQEIKLGLAALKQRIEVASRKVEETERRLSDVS
ncbi:hypothetical protein [Henriciella marina]|uniref:hypothetical protein n=1 Tax=Henriciella marina TaxID=453851 RepID=UPI00036BC9E5|nr:hypothetical protein [Henriciella marina]